MIRKTRLMVMLFCAQVGSVLATDGPEPINASMQARARGGADVAVGDSSLSKIDNSASPSLRPRGANSFDFSGQLLFTRLRRKGPIDDSTSHGMSPLDNMAAALEQGAKASEDLEKLNNQIGALADLCRRARARVSTGKPMKNAVYEKIKKAGKLPSPNADKPLVAGRAS